MTDMPSIEPRPLASKHIVLGVSGSIASYKAADLASKLTQAGALVDVILTDAAQHFVSAADVPWADAAARCTPTCSTRSRRSRKSTSSWRAPPMSCSSRRRARRRSRGWRTVSPTTCSALTALATTAPVLVAPAMDAQMWEHAATRANVATLRGRGVVFVGPEEGRLASGRMGAGRLANADDIIGAVRVALGAKGALAGRRIVVSAGGTQEPIDPVRYVGNRSSGKMGFAIAEAARDRGASVTLVTGPSALGTPYGVERIDVRTTVEMGAGIAAASSRLRCADHGGRTGGLPAWRIRWRRRSSVRLRASPWTWCRTATSSPGSKGHV